MKSFYSSVFQPLWAVGWQNEIVTVWQQAGLCSITVSWKLPEWETLRMNVWIVPDGSVERPWWMKRALTAKAFEVANCFFFLFCLQMTCWNSVLIKLQSHFGTTLIFSPKDTLQSCSRALLKAKRHLCNLTEYRGRNINFTGFMHTVHLEN